MDDQQMTLPAYHCLHFDVIKHKPGVLSVNSVEGARH
jgi:hypothetical protein